MVNKINKHFPDVLSLIARQCLKFTDKCDRKQMSDDNTASAPVDNVITAFEHVVYVFWQRALPKNV